MQWHLNIYGRCFGPIVYSALYQFRTVLELVKWTCVLTWCMWKLFFSSGAGVTDTCVLALKGRRCSGIRVKMGSGNSVCVHVDRTFHLVLIPGFFFPLALSPQSSRTTEGAGSVCHLSRKSPRGPWMSHGAQVQARSGAETENPATGAVPAAAAGGTLPYRGLTWGDLWGENLDYCTCRKFISNLYLLKNFFI